jgi:hypothetical protein
MKNAGKLLAILVAMRIRQYNEGCISWWSTSKALLKAHWMLPSVECLRRIDPAVTMVDEFE